MKTIAECAYAAGILDGEGSVFIREDKTKSPAKFCLGVVIANNDIAVLRWLEQRWGGHLHAHTNGRHFQWIARANIGLAFLRDVRPYAQIVSRQIEVAIAFQEFQGLRKGPARRTKEEIETQLEFKARLSLLNHSEREAV